MRVRSWLTAHAGKVFGDSFTNDGMILIGQAGDRSEARTSSSICRGILGGETATAIANTGSRTDKYKPNRLTTR